MSEPLVIGNATLYCGDCVAVMAELPEASVDAIVTDPPYHLTAGKAGRSGPASENLASPAGRAQATTGFMGKAWDGGDVAFRPETWSAALRLLKPGGHLVAFGGTRTYHRLASAIEDAGFEIRDQVAWLFGNGFPKSHDVGKAIDKAVGAEGAYGEAKTAAHQRYLNGGLKTHSEGWAGPHDRDPEAMERNGRQYLPGLPEARQWQGWGTGLKPAHEPICLARKPFAGTVAANVLAHGTGALNIDGCRVGMAPDDQRAAVKTTLAWNKSYPPGERKPAITFRGGADGSLNNRDRTVYDPSRARWPANLAHDGSEEVLAGFPDVGGASVARKIRRNSKPGRDDGYGMDKDSNPPNGMSFPDSGSAARFFYCAKAGVEDRLGSRHPTVKPLALMRWLCRLVTPPGGTILDPFAGTGTTGRAALLEGLRAVLIEREAEYQADIVRGLTLTMSGPNERAREIVKTKGQISSPGPLFDEAAE